MAVATSFRPFIKVLATSAVLSAFAWLSLWLNPISIQAQSCSGSYFCGSMQWVCQCNVSGGEQTCGYTGQDCGELIEGSWSGTCSCSDQCYSNPAWLNTCSGANQSACYNPTCGGGTCLGDHACYWYVAGPTPTPVPGGPPPPPSGWARYGQVLIAVFNDINGDGNRDAGEAYLADSFTLTYTNHTNPRTHTLSYPDPYSGSGFDEPVASFNTRNVVLDAPMSFAVNEPCVGNTNNPDNFCGAGWRGSRSADLSRCICNQDGGAFNPVGGIQQFPQWDAASYGQWRLWLGPDGTTNANVSISITNLPSGWEATSGQRWNTNSSASWQPFSGHTASFSLPFDQNQNRVTTQLLMFGIRQIPLNRSCSVNPSSGSGIQDVGGRNFRNFRISRQSMEAGKIPHGTGATARAVLG